jgi:hypothetical protein
LVSLQAQNKIEIEVSKFESTTTMEAHLEKELKRVTNEIKGTRFRDFIEQYPFPTKSSGVLSVEHGYFEIIGNKEKEGKLTNKETDSLYGLASYYHQMGCNEAVIALKKILSALQ